jgi:hypothetical protein
MTNNEKISILESTVSKYISLGYTVASKNTEYFMCTVYKPEEEVNHILHFLISVITCGLWVFVWLILSSGTEPSHSVLIKVNNDGSVTAEEIYEFGKPKRSVLR